MFRNKAHTLLQISSKSLGLRKASSLQASIPTCSELALVHKSLYEHCITQRDGSYQNISSLVYRVWAKYSLLLLIFMICVQHKHNM